MTYSSSSSNANSKEKIRFMKINIDDKTDVLTYHKKLLAEAVREKEELKTNLESFETSSKSLNKLLDSQLNANDNAGLGHDGAKESKESNSEDDEIVVKPKEVTKIVKPSFEKIESVNTRNETVRQAENPRKNNKSPRGNKRNWNGMMTQKLGENFEFNNKACYGTRVNTARPKAKVNTVKALASWVWKPKHEELAHVSKSNSASKTLTRYDYVDALGRFMSVLAWDFKRRRYGRKEHFILPRGRISTAGYEVSTASFILSTGYEYLVSVAAYPDLWIVVLRIGKLQGIGEFSVQMASGKEFSNPLIADSLLKIIWFSTHHASLYYEELAILGQTTTGKESSNPFMASSLPKTIHFCDSLQSDEDNLSTAAERFSEDASKQGRIHDAYATVTKEQKVDDDKETAQEGRIVGNLSFKKLDD
ncbi:hypothetical protein Tco_0783955 [Tanacetum coccineum]